MLLFLTPIYGFILSRASLTKKNIWWIGSGIMAGFCLQFHYHFILIIGLSLLFLIFKKEKVFYISQYLGGIIVGFSPLIVFDLRNNFYNLETIWKWLRFGGDTKFNFQIYYVMAFFPLATALLTRFINKYLKRTETIILTLVVIWGVVYVINQKQALGMPRNWHYSDLKVAEKIIKGDNNNDFNVVNLLSGDTRFYSLRYLLEIDNKKPKNVDEYRLIKRLWVVSNEEESEVINKKVWEIESFKPKKAETKIRLNNNIYLYGF
jgi:hypothetical protein